MALQKIKLSTQSEGTNGEIDAGLATKASLDWGNSFSWNQEIDWILEIKTTWWTSLILNWWVSNDHTIRFEDDWVQTWKIRSDNYNNWNSETLNIENAWWTQVMTYLQSGNVWIWTASPWAKLEVDWAWKFSWTWYFWDSITIEKLDRPWLIMNASWIWWSNRSNIAFNSEWVAQWSIETDLTNSWDDSFFIYWHWTHRLLIQSDGNVWIWTTAPWEKLEVNWAIRIWTTTNDVAWNIRWTGTTFEWYTGSAWVAFH